MVKHNNWRGCDGIDWVSYNDQADPDIVYRDYVFNYWDIEDAMWGEFIDATILSDDENETEKMFNEFIQANATNYLNDCIYGGYFMEGSKSWHDRR